MFSLLPRLSSQTAIASPVLRTAMAAFRCSGVLVGGSSLTRTLLDHVPVDAGRFEKKMFRSATLASVHTAYALPDPSTAISAAYWSPAVMLLTRCCTVHVPVDGSRSE